MVTKRRIGIVLSSILAFVLTMALLIVLPARVDINSEGTVSIALGTYKVLASPGIVFVRSTEGSAISTALTLNITDRVLVVGIAREEKNTTLPISIVFNTSENFTLELNAADGDYSQVSLYYLVAPTETTANVVITYAVAYPIAGYVAYFTGVDQNNPFTAATSQAQGDDSAPTVDVSSSVDEMVIDIMCQVSAGPDTITSNSGTKILDLAETQGGDDLRGGGQYQIGEATTTMLYGMSSTDDWNIIAGALQEPVADPVITSAPDTWTLNGITESGAIIPDTIYYANPNGDTTPPNTTVANGDCRFTVTNTSAMAIDLTCTMGAFTGGDGNMTNSDDGSNGAITYGAYSWFSGQLYADKVVIKSTNSDVGYDGLAPTTDIMWGAEVEVRTNAWTGGNSSTAILTITATVD